MVAAAVSVSYYTESAVRLVQSAGPAPDANAQVHPVKLPLRSISHRSHVRDQDNIGSIGSTSTNST